MRRVLGRSLLAFLALVSSACTHAPWNPHRGWRSWRTENVELHSDSLMEHEVALEWLQGSYEILRRTFFRDTPDTVVRVLYLQPGAGSPFLTLDGRYKFGAVIPRLPLAPPRTPRPLMVVGRFSHQRAYAHAMVHHLIEVDIPGAPLWLHEGFANYLSVFAAPPEKPGIVCFGQRQPAEARRILEPLETLFAENWTRYNDETAPVIDSTAWSFVDYLFHGEGGKLRARLRTFLRAIAGGQDTARAWTATYPELPLDALDERLRDHVRIPRPKVVCPLAMALAPREHPSATAEKRDVPEEEIRVLFEAIERLPGRRGHADFYLAREEAGR